MDWLIEQIDKIHTTKMGEERIMIVPYQFSNNVNKWQLSIARNRYENKTILSSN